MKSINWQTIGYVILGIFMLICYAYVDGKEILKKNYTRLQIGE